MAALKETVEDVKFKHLGEAMGRVESKVDKIEASVERIEAAVSLISNETGKQGVRIGSLEKDFEKIETGRKWRVTTYIALLAVFTAFIFSLVTLYQQYQSFQELINK